MLGDDIDRAIGEPHPAQGDGFGAHVRGEEYVVAGVVVLSVDDRCGRRVGQQPRHRSGSKLHLVQIGLVDGDVSDRKEALPLR